MHFPKLSYLIILVFTPFSGLSQNNFESNIDSLNVVNFATLKAKGKSENKKIKIGFWTEYELVRDTAETVPAKVQTIDRSFNILFPIHSQLQRKQGLYDKGLMNGNWKWFEASYDKKNMIGWRLIKESEYKNGKKNGVEREYDFSGSLIKESNYLNNILNGYQEIYLKPDYKTHKILFKNGVEKIITGYYETGQVRVVENFEETPLTRIIKYYESGRVKEKYALMNDELEGLCEAFDEKGNVTIRKVYRNGVEVN